MPGETGRDVDVAVIAIDGPAASGKGTIAWQVAQALGFGYLDSGSLYRVVALRAIERDISSDDGDALAALTSDLEVTFRDGRAMLDGKDVSETLRAEEVSSAASRIAVHAALRRALLDRQRAFRRPPGLVAEGRDMGTVVFPDATLKVFLTASDEARAARRYKQLIQKGFSANMEDLLRDLRERDARDTSRAAAPLKPAADAKTLDSSGLSIDQAVDQIIGWFNEVRV